MSDPHKSLANAYTAVLVVGGLSLVAGLIAVLFEVRFLEELGIGWASILSGIVFLVLAHYTKRGSAIALGVAIGLYTIDAVIFLAGIMRLKGAPAAGGIGFRFFMIWLMARGFAALRELNEKHSKHPGGPSLPPSRGFAGNSVVSVAIPSSGTGPKPVSFVAPAAQPNPSESLRSDTLSKALTPEILNLRFVAYRCEIAPDHFKAIYQNAVQKELKWFEVSALVIRQFPFQAPWEGKLILDIIPVIVAGEKIQPVRILSSTYVNYGSLPQGQSASTKENIRRLANFILSQNRSIFIDPGTDSFIQAGQPPVRFLSMSQFAEYDSRYG